MKGGNTKTAGISGNNSANKTKSGSTSVKNYNPKTTSAGGGSSKPSVVGKYSPAGSIAADKPTAVSGLRK